MKRGAGNERWLQPKAGYLRDEESEKDNGVLRHIRPVDLELALCRSAYDDPSVSRFPHDSVLASPGLIVLIRDPQDDLINQKCIRIIERVI